MDVIIYHNSDCGTSRNTLAMIRNAGVEPHVIEYLKTPPSRLMLVQLIQRMGISMRDLLREKQPNLTLLPPERIGDVAVFLCSEAAAGITGVALPVDGGWTAR